MQSSSWRSFLEIEIARLRTDIRRRRAERAELDEELQAIEKVLALFQAEIEGRLGPLYARLDHLSSEDGEGREGAVGSGRGGREKEGFPGRSARPPETDAVREERDRSRSRGARQERALGKDRLQELKRLYRKLARALHPDLALDPDEAARRQRLMAEVNEAYEAADLERLRRLAAALEQDRLLPADPLEGVLDGLKEELSRLVREIDEIRGALNRTRGSATHAFYEKAERGKRVGRDLVGDLEERLRREVEAREGRDEGRPRRRGAALQNPRGRG